ncbi:right-handed parallel beta-helix repeat-containing protein [Streptomyces sp. NPDC059979]|uniref:right-handed parallel beta-helix repeat-containing protein n=1 Tax=Streptomyces sp. NPDC059979 TaxID=3347021 RepID=UPI0036863ED5
MNKLGILAGTAAALATVVALPATDAHAQAVVLCSQTALRAAITQANAAPGPNTLFLAPGCTYNLTAADNPGNGLPVVTSDITIVGSFLGTQNVIRRQSATAFRIFRVQGPNAHLTLSRLTVRDGLSDSSGGGGILNDGGALTLNSVEVTSNLAAASGPGGGIESSGALTVRNSTVSYNRSTNNGGGLASFGTAAISNTTVTGNTAKDSGGGMDVRGSLTLTNSRVTENSSDDAGGILSFALTGTVTDTLIRGNTIAGDGSQRGGGLVNENGSTLTLERTTVFANRTLGSDSPAGGIANSGAGNTLTIRNSSVTYNYASEAPGGILNDGGTVTLTATPVQENFPTNCTPSVIAGCTG